MPKINYLNDWVEYIKCRGYCKLENPINSCWKNCRVHKRLSIKEQQKISKIEKKYFNESNIEYRNFYKRKINEIINPYTNWQNWDKLKEIEKNL